MPVGEHVDVGMGHSLAIQLARALRKFAIGQPSLSHQLAKRIAERFVAD
jgi:hypothetical protein